MDLSRPGVLYSGSLSVAANLQKRVVQTEMQSSAISFMVNYLINIAMLKIKSARYSIIALDLKRN